MNKIFSSILIFATVFGLSSCKNEEDDIFNASAAERLNAASDLYSARLTAQPNGWAMQYYPTYDDEAPNGKGYLILTRFNKDFTVDVSGYDWPLWVLESSGSAGGGDAEWKCRYVSEYREATSFWEVITDNGPVLSFNSYNTNMHYFSDPDFRETGTGFGGDYEFIVVEAPEDASYMMLKGKKRGTYNLLTPIEEGVDYAEYMADINQFRNKIFPSNTPTFNVIHLGDSIYKMEGAEDGLPNIYPYDGDAIANESFNPYLITRRGENYYMRFRDVREVKEGVTVQDFMYNKEKDVFESVDDPQYYICGDTVSRFFIAAIGMNKSWQLSRSAEMSDNVKAVYDQMYNDMKARKYTLSNVVFMLNPEGNVALGIRYNYNRQNSSVYYLLSTEQDGEDVTITYTPSSDSSEKLMELFPVIRDFVNLLAQRFTGSAATTQFDLNTIKLTSVQDPNTWIILTLR